MSMENFKILLEALRHHINEDMDQFDLWQLKDKIGNSVYIRISYIPGEGYSPLAFDDLDEWEKTQCSEKSYKYVRDRLHPMSQV